MFDADAQFLINARCCRYTYIYYNMKLYTYIIYVREINFPSIIFRN